MLTIKKASLIQLIYWLVQPLLFLLYWNFGRDTDVYVELFDSDNTYLEPFWVLLNELLALMQVHAPEIKAGSMVLVQCLGGSLLLHSAKKYKPDLNRYIFILFLIFSYEISFVGGALRQGISVFFVSAYLLGGPSWTYIAGVLSHWSGLVYLALRARFSVLLAVIVLVAAYFGYEQLPYVESALGRVESYVELVHDIDVYTLMALSFNKVLHILLVVYNRRRLKELLGSAMFIGIYSSPLIQLAVLWGTRSELIFQRAGMIFDPFIIVASVVMLAVGIRFTPWVLGSLVMLKLGVRLFGMIAH